MLRALKQRWRRRRMARRGIREVGGVTREPVDDWWVCPDGLGPESVIYSVGIGTNVRFDLAAIARFGATVHAFDPTPVSVEWVRAQELPERFVFHDYGLAGHDGTIAFFPPRKADGAHFTPVRRYAHHGEEERIEAPVKRLSTIARELGHEAIDLLKVDIEGGEYAVLDDVLEAGPLPSQLLVEFHHNFKTIDFEQTVRAVEGLRSAGYRLFHISARTYEMSFVR